MTLSTRPAVSTSEMVWIPGGTFAMGSDDHYPEEAPVRDVTVEGFWMDPVTVTNRDFARFVKETGYVTVAERAVDPEEYPGADPEKLVPSSVVFEAPERVVDLSDIHNWWSYVPGANWRRPQGPGSSVRRKQDHPVVHLAWEDAEAYATWAGKSIPTEAEWERAARGGLAGAVYAWGSEFLPGGVWMANTWQGVFPYRDTGEDGHVGTAPVGAFPANGYGLYDMIGNVWEWTSDWYSTGTTSCCSPGAGGSRKVLKGGSFLCAPNYCRRYRPAARMAHPTDTATCHLGLRLVLHPTPN